MYDSLELRWLRFLPVRGAKFTITRKHQLVFTGPGELTFLQHSIYTVLYCRALYRARRFCFVKQNILLLIIMSFFSPLSLSLRIRNSYFASGTGVAGIAGAFL